MLIFQNTFTNDPIQQVKIQLPNNTSFVLKLQYNALINGWYADIIYNTANFTLLGIKITNNLNILHNFRNKLGFGLSFVISDNGELWYKDDFLSGRVQVYLLDNADISSLENVYNNV